MSMRGAGQALFGVSIAVLGGLVFGWHDFVKVWPPLPSWIPWHDTLGLVYAAILAACGIALLVPRTAKWSSLALSFLLVLRLLLLPLPHVIAHPFVEGMWEELSENLIFVAGAWTIYALNAQDNERRASFSRVRIGQILFGLALPAIGLSHMFYLDQTAPLIPTWLPFHVPLAYMTGAAHIAAGIAIFDQRTALPRSNARGRHGEPVHVARVGADGDCGAEDPVQLG
jgi:uncharacterized membrane protein